MRTRAAQTTRKLVESVANSTSAPLENPTTRTIVPWNAKGRSSSYSPVYSLEHLPNTIKPLYSFNHVDMRWLMTQERKEWLRAILGQVCYAFDAHPYS